MRIMRHLWSSRLRSEIRKIIPSHRRQCPPASFLAAAILMLLLAAADNAFAGSATWNLNPTSGDWNTATDWTPPTIPNGSADTATFDASNTTGVSLGSSIEVNGIVFEAGASAFTINVDAPLTLTISGDGITNNSGIAQNFSLNAGLYSPSRLLFSNSATAGNLTFFTNYSCEICAPGSTEFFNSSTAGHGTFTNVGGYYLDPGTTRFNDSSTAGHGTFVNHGGASDLAFGGATQFFGTSTAGDGSFVNNAGRPRPASAFGAYGGITQFFGTSTAGSGTFENNGAKAVLFVEGGGITQFLETSTAGNGTFITNGGTVSAANGSQTVFSDTSTADNSTLIANGGTNGGNGGQIAFVNDSTGDTARVETFDNGNLNIADHNAPGVTVGSIEGDGLVFLGANSLTVGSNNRSTIFSGVIQDGGAFTKIGTGTLTLAGANTYTGGTTIDGGRLVVNNMSDSGTGSGTVMVNAGALGGRGSITGAVTVGTGSGAGALLVPGKRGGKPGDPLTVQSTLTFKSDATYEVGLDSTHAVADKVVATGVTIDSGALFSFLGSGHGTLTPGTVFTVIDNTSGIPIAGTFGNLAEGSTFTHGSNTFQASYEGGNGNDLTLTVAPP